MSRAGITLAFLGATGTVTGSKYLLTAGTRTILFDCGLFQGYKQLRLRNWAPLPVDARTIDVVVLTHAHIDHSGYLPLLVKKGFKGGDLLHSTKRSERPIQSRISTDSSHITRAT